MDRLEAMRTLIAAIDGSREGVNLSSALRMHVLAHYRRLAAGPEA